MSEGGGGCVKAPLSLQAWVGVCTVLYIDVLKYTYQKYLDKNSGGWQGGGGLTVILCQVIPQVPHAKISL